MLQGGKEKSKSAYFPSDCSLPCTELTWYKDYAESLVQILAGLSILRADERTLYPFRPQITWRNDCGCLPLTDKGYTVAEHIMMNILNIEFHAFGLSN